MEGQPELSVVVPLYNEEANVQPLVEAVRLLSAEALPPDRRTPAQATAA